MPVARISSIALSGAGTIGRRVAPAVRRCNGDRLPSDRAAELHAPRLRCLQGSLRAGTDQGALLLRQGGVDVQHERVGVDAQLGDDERHALDHQAADEVHVAPQAVELGDDHRGLELAGVPERRGQLRPTIQRIVALSGLDLGVAGGDLVAVLGRRK